jgi:predicted amidophosphoribosyltransferase
MPWIEDPCPRCALPRAHGCPPCPARRATFTASWAPVAHAGPARDLVLALKLRGALPAADVMAAQMLAGAPAGLLDGAVLVPVPAHAARRRRRGFDPAARIAAALSARSGLAVHACLTRGGPATHQVGRGRDARRRPVPIEAARAAPPGARAVLVDDVHTTGATLEACAQALEAAGFMQIAAMTYVRTLTDA